MDAYHRMCAEKEPSDYQKLRKNLLSYCERDTEAMVLLYQCLVNIVKAEKN